MLLYTILIEILVLTLTFTLKPLLGVCYCRDLVVILSCWRALTYWE